MRPQRVFSMTQLVEDRGSDVPAPVREVLQAFAQSIDQLVAAADLITIATSAFQIKDGLKAGQFDGVFLLGTIAAAATNTVFEHKLGRMPVGGVELLLVPKPDQVVPPVAQVAGSVVMIGSTGTQVTLRSTAANRQFAMILF